MIGVIANPSEYSVVSEFFELFKTPWQLHRRGQEYDAVLCAEEFDVSQCRAKLIIIYGGCKRASETEEQVTVSMERRPVMMSYKGVRLPIYGKSATFQHTGHRFLMDENPRRFAGYIDQSNGKVTVRIGYDLFAEIRELLTTGQPIANASIPALELHIALLRELIIESGIPLVEIPPIPAGYKFIACLTHDVDHPSITRHRFDHTMLGFIYRAAIDSLIGVFRKRTSALALLKNWAAVLKLPFVYLGLARDFWLGFDQYASLEGDAKSSFFVIPFSGRPGNLGDGPAPEHRSAAYGVADISIQIQKLMDAGCEIGVHGIDAWRDTTCAREELKEIRRATGQRQIGIRMHWLYFDERTPAVLEQAGFDYDSTVGYNGAVGYRAGTTQAYKPLETSHLLELPLHAMDTALFYPAHMNLNSNEARKLVGKLIENAIEFGGCLTVNWHDRSIAPERLWGDFYVELLGELKKRGAWLTSANEAVSWFRKRRSAAISEDGELQTMIRAEGDERLPGLQLRSFCPNGQLTV